MESPHKQVSEGCTGPNVKFVKEDITSKPGYFGKISQNVFFFWDQLNIYIKIQYFKCSNLSLKHIKMNAGEYEYLLMLF